MRARRVFTALFLFLLSAAVLAGCSEPENSEIFLMSTVITQQVYGRDKVEAVKAVNLLLEELDKKLSLFNASSDVNRINENAGIKPIPVDSYTFELLLQAHRYSGQSHGLFAITIAPVSLLWGIDTDHAHVPGADELEKAVLLVDDSKLVLDAANQTAFLTESGMAIDLGGIAKGYMAQVIGEEYNKFDVSGALVSIGGNICTYGAKPDGSPYILGIRKPDLGGGGAIMGKLKIGESVVATSGAYERYLEQDGKIYHHILNPDTGFPAETDLLSVTVISPNGGLSDFLSTVLFMAGSEAIETYRNDPRFQVIVIDKENRVYISDSLRDSFEIVDSSYTLAE